MSSGIYKLTFADGSIYIGKSANIDKRWSQHSKAMVKGTHTKRIQEAFEKYGDPKFELIFECHPDHIDILEGYFINMYWSDDILNTTRPAELSSSDLAVIEKYTGNIWLVSTFDHLRAIYERDLQIEALETKILAVKNGRKVKELEEDNALLYSEMVKANTENNRLKNRGFFERLFNT
jgi:group I intron endonuclease